MDREDDVPVCVACVVYAAYVLVLGYLATVVLYGGVVACGAPTACGCMRGRLGDGCVEMFVCVWM